MTKYIEDMKRRAKAIAREGDTKHTQALDKIARSQGYSHWGSFLRDHADTDSEGQSHDVLLKNVLVADGQSIAQKIEYMLDDIHTIISQAEIDWTHITSVLPVDIGPREVMIPDNISIKGAETKEEFKKRTQSDIQKIGDLIECAPSEYGIMSMVERDSITTVFQIIFTGGIAWQSEYTQDGIVHTCTPRSLIPLAPYLPDTQDSWTAAHNWTVQHYENSRHVDPLLWGFKPSGLIINPPGGWAAKGVAGCRYTTAQISEYARQKDFQPKPEPVNPQDVNAGFQFLRPALFLN